MTSRLLPPGHMIHVLTLPLVFSSGLLFAADPDFSRTPRAQIPPEFTWNVEDLFKDEAAWRAEFAAVKQRAETVDALAKGWTASPGAMADLLERITEIQRRSRRVGAYASLQGDMDLGDSRLRKMNGEVRDFSVGFGAKLAFLASDVLQLGQEKVASYLQAEPRLAPYRKQLENILREKDHVLPGPEQRIASLTRLFSDTASKSSEMLNNLDLPRAEITLADGSKVQLDQAAFRRVRASANPDDRRNAMAAYFGSVKPFENTFAALMEGNIKQHLFTARIHKHPTCLEATLFANAIEPAVYRNLIAATRANLDPMHRLLKLRQRLLGLPEFRYGDIYASAVATVDRRYSWDEGKRLVAEAVAPLGEEYGEGIRRAFDERWIDVYPNKGKQSGAYSSGVPGVHPYVKMNYDHRYREVATLAHELGHALHSWLSDKHQPPPLVQYPIFLAEIASTFNENLLMSKLLGTEKDDRLKLFLLDNYLEGLRGTLYRQTLFAEFELAMHEAAEQGRTLTPDFLNGRYLELTRAYYGHAAGVVKVEDYIQSEWAVVPHFFMNYYVYQYATGVIASMALADALQTEGAPARERYLTFLKSGGSDYPLATLQKAGVDMTKRETLARAFKVFDRYVDEMERIAARLPVAAGQ